jgi:hypothetical protein
MIRLDVGRGHEHSSGTPSPGLFKMARRINQEHKAEGKERFNRFVETARTLGCDEDKERFEQSLGKIAAYKPPPVKPKKPKTKNPGR